MDIRGKIETKFDSWQLAIGDKATKERNKKPIKSKANT